MDIFATCDERHETIILRSGEASSGNLFDLSFLWKIEISTTHRMNLKYDYCQEIRSRPRRYGDISQR